MAEEDTEASSGGASFAASQILPAASREKADAFIDKQNKLADLQIEELKRENAIRHWSLRVRHISDVMKLGFELALGFIVVAVAVGFGAIIWSATRAEGLVIESFAVPGRMADKGLTGQVIANKLLDRLTVIQNATDSSRGASSFANDWTNDIKVQIPDTGVSLGEVVRFLHNWLGRETHLSGELYETPAGIAVTVRMDNEPGQTFEGPPGDLNGIVVKASEAVFAHAQPYRYAIYLSAQGRNAESVAVLRNLAATGPPVETAWADLGLAIAMFDRSDDGGGRAYIQAGQKANPNLPNFYYVLSDGDASLGHDESMLYNLRRFGAAMQGGGGREWNPRQIPPAVENSQAGAAALLGDYRDALAKNVFSAGNGGDLAVQDFSFNANLSMHDVAASRRVLARIDALVVPGDPQNSPIEDAAENRGALALALQDWRGAIAHFDEAGAATRALQTETKGWRNGSLNFRDNVVPQAAYAHAMLGQFDQADALFKTLPGDCDICGRMRGKAEEARRNWAGAEYWFALVSARSPSIPFADTDWGHMLMARGDPTAAIVKFESAHRKGPHFADPLEMWGEALIAQNRSDLAIAKFAEAARYAPAWGRLHLKWGEALLWSGKKDEAAKQFAIAAGLDLPAADRATLMRLRG